MKISNGYFLSGFLFIIGVAGISPAAFAETTAEATTLPSDSLPSTAAAPAAPSSGPTLEDELSTLTMPSNQAPAGVDSEKLYSVQNRYTPLKHRLEVSLGAGRNFTTGGLLSTGDFSLGLNFYFSSKWAVGAHGVFVTNKFTNTFNNLGAETGLYPDVLYSKYKFDLSVIHNLFYGKFRVSMDKTFYFDQYISLGPAYLLTNKGNFPGAVADVGIVFWMGKNFTTRLGLRDYVYQQKYSSVSRLTNDLIFHVDAGYLLGRGAQ